MRIFEKIDDIDIPDTEKTVVILGKFDGLHMGHQTIIDTAKRYVKKNNYKMAVFTFVFEKNGLGFITDNAEKTKMFEGMGVDYLIACNYKDICDISAKAFINKIIIEKIKAYVMVAGTDCRFGKGAQGDGELAAKLMKEQGREVVLVEKIRYENREIGSTYIKELIGKGDLTTANKLLGYNYSYSGIVKCGNQLGRTISFPTVNIVPDEEKIISKYGVYASYIYVDSKCYKGITNVGIKPTVGEYAPIIETHIFDFDEDIYGKRVTVELLEFVRPERKFNSLSELKAQIKEDISSVLNIFEKK